MVFVSIEIWTSNSGLKSDPNSNQVSIEQSDISNTKRKSHALKRKITVGTSIEKNENTEKKIGVCVV